MGLPFLEQYLTPKEMEDNRAGTSQIIELKDREWNESEDINKAMLWVSDCKEMIYQGRVSRDLARQQRLKRNLNQIDNNEGLKNESLVKNNVKEMEEQAILCTELHSETNEEMNFHLSNLSYHLNNLCSTLGNTTGEEYRFEMQLNTNNLHESVQERLNTWLTNISDVATNGSKSAT